MAKSQKRSNKEIKKPKQEKPKAAASSTLTDRLTSAEKPAAKKK